MQGTTSIALTLEKDQNYEIKYDNGLIEKIRYRNNLNQVFKSVEANKESHVSIVWEQMNL